MKKFNVIIFISILLVLGLLNAFQAKDTLLLENENRTIKKPVFSQRNLFSGDYFKAYDVYFSDTFLMRDVFLDVSNKLSSLKGLSLEEDVEIITTSAINVGNKISERPDELNNTSSDAVIEEDIAITKLGKILIVDNKAMEIHTVNEEAEVGYPSAINYISERIDANVYSILVPTRIEFTEKDKYKDISYSQKSTIDNINSHLIDKVTPVDVYSQLELHQDDYNFMRTDHHWTAIGAYKAYEAFMSSLNIKPIPLEAFEMHEFEGYLGSLYRVSQSEKLKENPDSIFAFMPIVNTSYSVFKGGIWTKGEVVDLKYFDPTYTTNHYGVYLQGDSSVSIITSDVDNNRSLLIIKDSYANSFIPFLTSHFKTIHIIDPRMFEANVIDYINEQNIDDVLFLNYVLVNRYMGYTDLFNAISGNPQAKINE